MSAADSQSKSVAWRVVRITLVAAALYVGFRLLPTGTNLSHMDFRVEGGNAIEMCDPASPQFLPVTTVRSPVSLGLVTTTPPRAGREVEITIVLKTTAGKPISPVDLLNVHTKLLHLMIVDPALMDYHHVHPKPLREPGHWAFSFTPEYGGEYRFFADFTPAATGLSLYASGQLTVAGAAPAPEQIDAAQTPSWQASSGGVVFDLQPAGGEIRARQETVLTLSLWRPDGGEIGLEPVMEAFAHVVAFDRDRTGFAHLHPLETNLAVSPDRKRPTLTFRLLIPNPGRYVAWAQINDAGTERFAPFWFDVK
ncbi:MAG: hypothetical protein IT582_03365 [Opitutaceae bacterium]|nr:hypothetical protein [Opitutaceae bacterium]